MARKRGAASLTRTTSAKRRKIHDGARTSAQVKPADTTVPLATRSDAQDLSTASICEYCRSLAGESPQQQPATLLKADYVETNSTAYRVGDIVKANVRYKGQKARLERAAIAEIGQLSVILAWFYDTDKTKSRKKLLEGKVGPSQKFILSSHVDPVAVDALARLLSPDERKAACTDWVLHPNGAQVIYTAELHDGCLMRSLVEKVRARELSQGYAAPGVASDDTFSQQEINSPSALEQEENGELADLRNQATPQSKTSASSSYPDDLEKQRKRAEGRAEATGVQGETKKVRRKDQKVKKKRQIPEALVGFPHDHAAKEDNINSSNKYSRSAAGARCPKRAYSTVSQDTPEEGLLSIPHDQLGVPSDTDIAGGEGRREQLSKRSAIMNALKTNCFEGYVKHTGLTVHDIHTLIPKHEDGKLPVLNDNIINKYITMLVKKACETDGSTKAQPYGAIDCLWLCSKKVLSRNRGLLSSVNDVLMPLCYSTHWSLLVVSTTKKTIQYLDSLHNPSEEFVDKVREWIKLTLGAAYYEDDWKTIEEQHSPQQDNFVDCGVAVLLNARAITMGLPVHPDLYSFERKVMLAARYEFAVDLLSSTVDFKALPSAKKGKQDLEGVDETPPTKNEYATQTVEMRPKSNPSKNVAPTKYALDASDFEENDSSYEVNNDSPGDQIDGSDDEADDHPLSTPPCRNGTKVAYKNEEGAAPASDTSTEGPTTAFEEGNEKEAKLPLKVPILPTEHRALLFGRSEHDSTRSKREMHGTSLPYQNDDVTQQSEARAKVQFLHGFKQSKDRTTNFGLKKTEKRLRGTISGEGGMLGSLLPTGKTTKKDPTATGAHLQASTSAYQRDRSTISQGENLSLDRDSLLESFRTVPPLRYEDKFMITHGTNLTDKAIRDGPRSITYSHTSDRLVTDTQTLHVEVEASSPASQGFVHTGMSRASNLQPKTVAPMRPNFAATHAIQPPQLIELKKTMSTEISSNLSRGLGRRLREQRSQVPLRLVCSSPATDPFLDSEGSETGDYAAGQQSILPDFQPAAASARIRRGRNPFDGPDSCPDTPRIAPKDTALPRPNRASTRKGVSVIGISRPAEVGEEYWKGKSTAEQRRIWHFHRINSEAFGQSAPQPCQQCVERRDNARKTPECRVYKDDEYTKVQQCAPCLFSRKGCSFAPKPSSAKVPPGETQLIAGVGRNTVDAPSQAEPPSWEAVVWVMFPDNQPFHESATLFIQNSLDDISRLDYNAWLWFNKALESGLGDLAVLNEEDGICVHQGLLTMLATQYGVSPERSLSVRFHKWIWLHGQLQKLQTPRGHETLLLPNSEGQPQRTVIFIHATTRKPPEIEHVYEDVRTFRITSGTEIRVYPNMREWRRDQEKIRDIQVLDEIAKCSGRPEYSYRPRTCFGGPCKLKHCDKTVLKRSHSEGKKHVKIIDEAQKDREGVGKLTCTYRPQKPERPSRKHKKEKEEERAAFGVLPHWFHQEYVPDLSSGEFRVFIRSRPKNEEGTGARGGEVIAMAWTTWNDDGELHAMEADEHHFGGSPDSTCGALSKSDLTDFCLYVFESLRARNSPCYESLEVGVRLDVGVGDCEGQKQFFVNEISRWYNAHYFSYTILAKPWTKICKAFAEAFRSYLQDGMPDFVD